MADAKVLNLARILGRFYKIPAPAKAALEAQLKTEAVDLVDAIKRAMDVAYSGESDADHEHLRDSVHAYKNPDRVIGYRILADAKDANGEFIGSHVEAGHRAADGTHVAAAPAFYPTYRARKKAMQGRLRKAGRDAIKQAYEG